MQEKFFFISVCWSSSTLFQLTSDHVFFRLGKKGGKAGGKKKGKKKGKQGKKGKGEEEEIEEPESIFDKYQQESVIRTATAIASGSYQNKQFGCEVTQVFASQGRKVGGSRTNRAPEGDVNSFRCPKNMMKK